MGYAARHNDVAVAAARGAIKPRPKPARVRAQLRPGRGRVPGVSRVLADRLEADEARRTRAHVEAHAVQDLASLIPTLEALESTLLQSPRNLRAGMRAALLAHLPHLVEAETAARG